MAGGSGVKLATFGTDDRDRSGREAVRQPSMAPFSLFAENERREGEMTLIDSNTSCMSHAPPTDHSRCFEGRGFSFC